MDSPLLSNADDVQSSLPREGSATSWATVALGCLNIFFFGGLINGWAPFQLMLEEEGVFADICPSPEEARCDARSSRLLFLFTLGSTSSILMAYFGGVIADTLGPTRVTLLNGLMVSAGLLLLGVSPGSISSSFLFVTGFDIGCCLIAIGGLFDLLSSMPLAFVVKLEDRPLVLSAINVLYDGSSVCFLFVYEMYYFGLSRQAIFIPFAVFCAVVHLSLAGTWSSGSASLVLEAKRREAEEAAALKDAKDVPVQMPRQCSHPMREQLQSFEFSFAVAFFSIQVFRSSLFLGTGGKLLEEYGDAQYDHVYTRTFTALLPVAMFFLPLINWILTSHGFKVAYPVILAMGVIYNGINLVPILPLQIASFVIFTVFRAMLYSTHVTYVSHTFGSRTSTTVNGLIMTVSAFMNFLISPVDALSKALTGSVYAMYVLTLLICLPLIVQVGMLRKRLLDNPVDDCAVLASL